ncbi:InlB B-repeat-containing protein [Sporolactobacillus kofuensis]|uniref:InlB B-repeat-containing protein n=1 Tax=Sporolactobacillus kofuensis TaxID=269672 RepID=A0ABW1WCD7_9BACL|nr:InlB B-repeat-containing protein [Sporolactobacillus kofuensis]MCO7175459.1 InlB B-repeat-containing protein [Sporolactobacillus kofuensis]
MKRSISVGLIIIMFIYLIQSTFGATVAYAGMIPMQGSGTSADPYIITTAAQLDSVRNDLSASYKLGNDIDLSSYDNWQPIGTIDNGQALSGTFDGDGHTISNLKINRPDLDDVGLFAHLENGTVKNVKLENVNVNGRINVGGLVGFYRGDTISNSSVSGEINGSSYVGGLVGYSEGTINGSYSTADVIGAQEVGGLVGENDGNINTSFASGHVQGTGSVGGLVGYFQSSDFDFFGDPISVNNSYASGSVQGSNGVGGLIGRAQIFMPGSVTISNSYASGSISGTNSVGGITGASSGVTITNSFYDKETAGLSSSTDNAAKSTVEMQTKSTYTNAGWDFNSIWKMNPGEYPKLSYQVDQAYQITYDPNGGTGTVPTDPTNYSNGDSVTVKGNSGNLVKTGFSFNGWNTKADGTGTAYQPESALTVTGNVTLYAQWNKNQYTVTYNSNGGSAVAAQTIDYEGQASKPTDPTQTGYTFGGWYSDSEFNNTYDFNTPVTENTTLYAKWSKNQYTVTYNSNGGSSIANQTVDYENRVSKPIAPTRTGYAFAGWYKDSGLTEPYDFNTPVTENTTLYAQWNKVLYTITFDSNEGSTVPPQMIAYQDKILNPLIPFKTGFLFSGWYSDSNLTNLYDFNTPVTGNTTLYAKWSVMPPSIISQPMNQTINRGQSATFSVFSLSFENTFQWYKDGAPIIGQTGPSLTISNAQLSDAGQYYVKVTNAGGVITSIPALLIVNPTYSVTYNENGNTSGAAPVDNQSYSPGTLVTILNPLNLTKTGYSFNGWNTKADGSGTDYQSGDTFSITGNVTLYAKWNKSQYTFTYDSNGGSAIGDQHIDYEDKASQPADPTRTGYTFAGWYSDTELNSPYDFTTPVTGNVKLYAKWDKNSYTVTYDSNGGSAIGDQHIDYEDQASQPADPTRTGYTFAGWYSDTEFNSPYDFTTPVTGNVKLYAKWDKNSYDVTFDSNGGSAIGDQHIDYEDQASQPADPTRTGYTFAGWYSDTEFNSPYDFDTPVTGHATLYAKWNKNHYIVAFDSNGGSAISNQTIDFEDKASQPAEPTRTGYTFAGWYKDSDLTEPYDFHSPVTGNTTLYAKWDKNRYTVTYDSNGGSSVSDQTIDFEDKANKPAEPIRAGYTFAGWYSDSAFNRPYDFDTPVTGDTTFYAKWLSAESTLSALKLPDSATLSPVFNVGQSDYMAMVDNKIAQLTITFSRSEGSQNVTVDGSPVEGDHANVPLTVGKNTIKIVVTAADGVTKRTYTLHVTRAEAAKSTSKIIYADVTSKSIKDTLTKTPITQSENSDGTVTNSVSLTNANALEAVKNLNDTNNKVISIVIPDGKDPVSKVNVSVPNQAVDTLSQSRTGLQIITNDAHILVPHRSLADFNQDLYFSLVPVRNQSDRQRIVEQATQQSIVRAVLNGDSSSMQVLGQPMQIETNMQNHRVTLTLPIPTDVQLTDEMLNNLVIFIEHSDGTREVIRGQLVNYESGVRGIQFDVTKFSTFTMLYVKNADKLFAKTSGTTDQHQGAKGKDHGSSTTQPAEKKTGSASPSKDTKSKASLPKTGDEFDRNSIIAGMILVLSGLFLTVRNRRKKRRS